MVGCPQVYFIRDCSSGEVKIGYSDDPEGRLRQFQTGSNARLIPLGTTFGHRDTEAVYHRKYADFRTSGEWFDLDRDALENIEYMCGEDCWEAHGFSEPIFPWKG
jgi:hypothetical protein